jgi:hypothetical protein
VDKDFEKLWRGLYDPIYLTNSDDEIIALQGYEPNMERIKTLLRSFYNGRSLYKGMWHETCIVAAIRLPDGRIIRGQRHSDCIKRAVELVEWNGGKKDGVWDVSMSTDQGFITSLNRYVGREEGYQLQIAAGIESVASGGYRGETLFSEDLY